MIAVDVAIAVLSYSYCWEWIGWEVSSDVRLM